MPARTVLALALAVSASAAVSACATLPAVDPAFYRARSFALVSVHARADVAFESPGLMFALADNELGTEVVEMTLGDTEAELAQLFGVEELMPLGKVIEHKSTHALPEAQPPEAWSQINEIIAVDLDDPRTRPALGRVAAAVGVDAAVVLRHEWSLARDRLEIANGITAFDRCSLLVVDAHGRTLIDDVVLVRLPVTLLWSEQRMVGVNGATWSDEARTWARRTGRECLAQFKVRLAQARQQTPKG